MKKGSAAAAAVALDTIVRDMTEIENQHKTPGDSPPHTTVWSHASIFPFSFGQTAQYGAN